MSDDEEFEIVWGNNENHNNHYNVVSDSESNEEAEKTFLKNKLKKKSK